MTARILGTRIYPAPEPDAPDYDERDFGDLTAGEQAERMRDMDASELREMLEAACGRVRELERECAALRRARRNEQEFAR